MTQAVGFYGTDGFGYDAVGNLLARSRASGGTTTSVSYSYNTATNQLSKAAQTGGSTLSYSYDAAGNLIARKLGKTTQLALSYNADGRPAGAASESYLYDGFGERVAIGTGGGCLGICGGGGSVYSSFIFGRGGELLAENNGSGQPVRSYVYLNGLPLALVDSPGNIAYILADQVGQPQRMVDGSGALVWDRVPDVFGATVAQPVGMSAANPLRFPGQQYDAATGLHYNHFRDYDPSLGRYVQSDPIGLAGGINTYAYVGGNPISNRDPFGLKIVVSGSPVDYNTATGYLLRDPGMAKIIRDLDASSTVYNIQYTNDNNDRYDPLTNTIYWDPNSALCTTSGGTQTPALGLGHEMAHADASFWDRLIGWIPWPRYDNLEERRVITGPETNAAQTLGEGIRNDHGGTPYRVSTPISR